MPALLRDWTDEKTASIDWTDAEEVLQHCKSLLHITMHHPQLDKHCSEVLSKKERFDLMKLFINSTKQATLKKKELINDWNQKGLFKLRSARWCRRCGQEGHTMKDCPDQGIEAFRRKSGQLSAVDRHKEHLEELDRRRLAEEKKSSSESKKNRGAPKGGSGAKGAEISEEWYKGQIKAVEHNWQKGEIFIQGFLGMLSFHFDRSEYGLKRIRMGDTVKLRVETYDDRRMAVDVTPLQRELTMEDIMVFTQQCNECSDTIRQIKQTLAQKSDWRNLVNTVAKNESLVQNTVTAIIRLTTFRRNLEPININLLRAFLKLLLLPCGDGLSFFPSLVLRVCPKEDTALLHLEEKPNFVDTLLDLADFIQILRIHSKVTPAALNEVIAVLKPIIAKCLEAVQQVKEGGNSSASSSGAPDTQIVQTKLQVALNLIDVAEKKDPLVPIVPTPRELAMPADLKESSLFSGNLPIATRKYRNSVDHVDAHAKLLRADTFHAISQTLAAGCFELPGYEPSENTKGDVEATRQYDSLKVLGQAIWKGWEQPSCYIVQVTPKKGRKMEDIYHYALSRQCFVCITTGQDRTRIEEGEVFWGMVGDTDLHLKRQGIISVTPISGSFELMAKNIRRNQEAGMPEKSILLETMVFYNGYLPVMQAMQEFLLPRSPPLPLQETLVHGKLDSSGVKYVPSNCKRIFDEMINATRDALTLDHGQDAAIRALPNNNVVLVQGPPGTGKSFIGCRVVESYIKLSQRVASGEVLIDLNPAEVDEGNNAYLGKPLNQEDSTPAGAAPPTAAPTLMGRGGVAFASGSNTTTPGGLGPVVVITYKNHALDEFLLDLKRSGLWCSGRRAAEGGSCACTGNFGRCCPKCCSHQARLVRIGSGSQEPELAALNLNAIMQSVGSGKEVAQSRGRVKTLTKRIERVCAEVSMLEKAKITEQHLKLWLTEEQRATFNLGQLSSWLDGENFVGKADKRPVPDLQEILGSHLKTALEYRVDTDSATVRGGAAGDDSDDDADLTVFQAMRREANASLEDDNCRPTMISRESLSLFTNPSCSPQPPEDVPSGEQLKSLWSLSKVQRASYLAYLIKKHIALKASEYLQCCSALETALSLLNHARDQVRLEILQSVDVIGLTTTGCAMNQSLLRAVKPRMLMVEEAAEILESQLLACMTSSLEQVVLIGDHYQLQPKVETQELCKVNKLNVSMFERLAREMPPSQLVEQRRMVPALSRLVRPYYDKQQLIDHFSVNSRALIDASGYKHVNACPGLPHPVFLWTHTQPEEVATIGRSKINTLEINMVEGLVCHLIRQKVKPSSITVITPYLGQRRAIVAVLRNSRATSAVKVSTVDRFQGDENDVIILSMVRTAKLTSFLRLRNRLIVACSRARFALTIIGSDELLQQSPHWAKLMEMLKPDNVISNELPISLRRNIGTADETIESAKISSADAISKENWPQ